VGGEASLDSIRSKVGTFRVSALGQTQDAYVARVKNGTSDWVSAIAFTDSGANQSTQAILANLAWTSLHVRSYKSEKQFHSAMNRVVSPIVLGDMALQPIKHVDWGKQEDFELHAQTRYLNSSVYQADRNIGFAVTLHSNQLENDRGNELEDALEFIPAIMTCNFTLTK
ncbi:MAG: hypothetical protein ACMG6E_06560, partial [Candidatus Roizmanbacteria bacterium]